MGGHYAPPPVTLVFLKVERQNLVTWGILMCVLKKWHQFSNSGLSSRHYDVKIGNMEGLVTLLFFKVERQNLPSFSILMCIFQKPIYFLNSRLL